MIKPLEFRYSFEEIVTLFTLCIVTVCCCWSCWWTLMSLRTDWGVGAPWTGGVADLLRIREGLSGGECPLPQRTFVTLSMTLDLPPPPLREWCLLLRRLSPLIRLESSALALSTTPWPDILIHMARVKGREREPNGGRQRGPGRAQPTYTKH